MSSHVGQQSPDQPRRDVKETAVRSLMEANEMIRELRNFRAKGSKSAFVKYDDAVLKAQASINLRLALPYAQNTASTKLLVQAYAEYAQLKCLTLDDIHGDFQCL